MPPTLYRSTGYALSHLIEEIKHGTLALPDIQATVRVEIVEGP